MGDPFRTWTANDRMWLKDFLPTQLPSARIFTYGYNSTVAFSKSVAGIEDFARNLLTRLELERLTEKEQGRPILFVCHSLGGIVVKKALVIAHDESPTNYKDIIESVRGVAFLGVPHGGAAVARLGYFFAELLKKATLGRTTNASLAADLRGGSKILREVTTQSVHRLAQLRICSFFEREKTWGELIVDEDSARLNIQGERAIPVDANHQDICRFGSEADQNYKLVGGSIVRLAREIISIHRSSGVQAEMSFPKTDKLDLESVCCSQTLVLDHTDRDGSDG